MLSKALGKTLGKLSKSLWKKHCPSFSWLGEHGSTVHLDFCCTVLVSHGLCAFTFVKQSKRCDFDLRHANPCAVPGFAELPGEGVLILPGGFCFPSVLHKYLKVSITRATRVS